MNITQEKKSELLHLLKSKKMFGIEHIGSIDFKKEKKQLNELPSTLESLFEYVSNCSLCELSKSKITFDFGRGDIKSKILFITLNNDYNTQREYNNYSRMIENELSININDIYMTNILKCTVKTSQNIGNDEVHKCLNYTEQQIRILKPELIVTFGSAFKYLMNNNDDIIEVSGNLYKYTGINVVPLLGLDFINKNPSYNEKMFIDLKKIKKIMDEK